MIQLITRPVETDILVKKALYDHTLQSFKGKKLIIVIEEYAPDKLAQKRRVYFASIVNPAAKHFGVKKQDLHDELKIRCNSKEHLDPFTGEIKRVGGSTREFKTKDEWDAYMNRCRALLNHMGAKLLTASEYYERISAEEDQPTQSLMKGY